MQNRSTTKTPSLSPLKKVLVIGNGGRENSLAWALGKSKTIEKIFVAPGNGGTENHPKCHCIEVSANQRELLFSLCFKESINLVVIGPEAPLAEGLANYLRDKGITVFGPCSKGAKLEASKKWAKQLMKEAFVPTAKYWAVNNKDEAYKILRTIKEPLVVKADGLAAGKGVVVPDNLDETKKAIQNSFEGKFGSAGSEIVLEEKMQGPEVSIFALCDGKDFVLLPPAQDHKRLGEGDKGPNTGGMGAYAPAGLLAENDLHEISNSIIRPTLEELKKRGIDYRGVIYAGLMLTMKGPKVIEFNCRFGDPECQALMPLMGQEFGDVLYACALGNLAKSPTLTFSNKYSACVIAAAKGYPENPRGGDPIEIKMKKDSSLEIFHSGTRYNEKKQLVSSGGRVLSIVGYSENFDKAFKKVYESLNKIYFPGMIYRKDIGHQVRNN